MTEKNINNETVDENSATEEAFVEDVNNKMKQNNRTKVEENEMTIISKRKC